MTPVLERPLVSTVYTAEAWADEVTSAAAFLQDQSEKLEREGYRIVEGSLTSHPHTETAGP